MSEGFRDSRDAPLPGGFSVRREGKIIVMAEDARDVEEDPERVRLTDKALTLAEDVVYAGIALILTVGAGGLLVVAGRDLLHSVADEDTAGDLHVLDTLLLVFIFVELLYAVRLTLKERQVLVEPFLLVGVLAAIKEIVVLTVEAASQVAKDPDAFERSVIEVGVLAGLVVALAVSAVLLRRKEREPQEADRNGAHRGKQAA